jgi:hypothetical protein
MPPLITPDDNITEYPKIENLWRRDEVTHRVVPGQFRCPEFASVSAWRATEKIDGMNVRIALTADGRVLYGGRTANATLSGNLLKAFETTFPLDRLRLAFPVTPYPIVLYGEAYGAGIQKGGAYRKDVAIRIFDILEGRRWHTQDEIDEAAVAGGWRTAPPVAYGTWEGVASVLVTHSRVALEDTPEGPFPTPLQEGIVARSDPLMLDRFGGRVMWKLKNCDFRP